MTIVELPMSLKELSHELRTPLTGIVGVARLLEDEMLTREQRALLEDLLHESDKLVLLANRLNQAKTISSSITNANSAEGSKLIRPSYR